MERASSDGFSFSQDLTSGLSQGLSQMYSQSQMSQNSQSSDCTWYSGDSQSLSQPMGIVPQKRAHFDQLVPPSFPEVKKAKYNLPKWTKGLLKTAEENQKLKTHDILMKQQEEDTNYLKMFIQDVQKSIAGFPELVAQMVKQSTDFLVKEFEKRNDGLKKEMVNHINDTVGQELSHFRKQHLDNTFETWNYLSEIKNNLDEIKTLLDDKKSESSDVMTKIDQCCESILRVQQKVEEKSGRDANQEKGPSFRNIEVANQKELLNESDSDDEFQVSVLRSREKAKRKTIFQQPKSTYASTPTIFQQPKPTYTSTPIPNYHKKAGRTLLDDDETEEFLSIFEP